MLQYIVVFEYGRTPGDDRTDIVARKEVRLRAKSAVHAVALAAGRKHIQAAREDRAQVVNVAIYRA